MRSLRRRQRKAVLSRIGATYRASWFSTTGERMPEHVRKAWPADQLRLLA